MVRPVELDARGIVAPDAGLERFALDRFAPSQRVARFVDRYWVVTWDLRGKPSHTQHVLAHPVVNVTFSDGADGLVTGVTTAVTQRTLTGVGCVLGIMFRPAGFRPLLGRSMATITDRQVMLNEIVGGDVAAALAGAVAAHRPEGAAMAAAVDALLAEVLPVGYQRSEATTALVERVAGDPAIGRVEDVAALTGTTTRQLQRRFRDHVGMGPKAVLRRYRLYEAAERARHGEDVHWAALAADLGYSDQSHLTKDFTATFGLSPGNYVRANQP